MTAAEKPFGLSEIGQIARNVRDLDAAIAFYRDILGMKFLFQAPPGMAFFDCGGIRLLLGVAEDPEAETSAPTSILYYRVDDIDAAYRTLVARGVEFGRAPELAHKAEGYELWLAFFHDPDRNRLALMSEVT
jgi:catechol 2,3-dioxygenase-like lactoylglutathione lyase family enzyme